MLDEWFAVQHILGDSEKLNLMWFDGGYMRISPNSS